MCKDDRLKVIWGILQKLKLLEQGLARTQEMLLQINQWSFDDTTTEERVDSGLDTQALTTTTIFQIDDIDAFDSDCDEMSTTSVVFMANLCAYDLDVLSKVSKHDTYQDNNVIDQQHARALKPLDNALDYACKFTTRIQELLVYVSATCLSSQIGSEKLVAVTPMNKNRQVRQKQWQPLGTLRTDP
nr:hypothetical protein [Tanacetum cinerariifolium]